VLHLYSGRGLGSTPSLQCHLPAKEKDKNAHASGPVNNAPKSTILANFCHQNFLSTANLRPPNHCGTLHTPSLHKQHNQWRICTVRHSSSAHHTAAGGRDTQGYGLPCICTLLPTRHVKNLRILAIKSTNSEQLLMCIYTCKQHIPLGTVRGTLGMPCSQSSASHKVQTPFQYVHFNVHP
jgi:hypothetical protein